MREIDKLYLALLIFMLLLLFSVSADTYGQTWTGSGTQANPYIIDTYQELVDMGNPSYYDFDAGVYFKLGADINCTWDEVGNRWNTIGVVTPVSDERNWRGHFNGDHHTITNLDFFDDWNFTSNYNYFRGFIRNPGWVVAPTAADTSTPLIYNVIFDSIRVGGSWDGTTSGADLIMGLVAGSHSNSTHNVSATYAFDSIIVRNIQYDASFEQTRFQQAVFGNVLGILSTQARANRIVVEDVDMYIARDASTTFSGSYRANSIGGVFGVLYTDSYSNQVAVDNVNMYITEQNSTTGIGVGLIAGATHFGLECHNVYAQGIITMSSAITTASYLGGFFGYNDQVSGVSNTPYVYSSYSAVVITPSSNDYEGLLYGYSDLQGIAGFNFFGDATIETANVGGYDGSGGSNYMLGDTEPDAYGQNSSEVQATTAQLKTQSFLEILSPLTTGTAFDFTDVWAISGGDYPYLMFAGPMVFVNITSPSGGTYQSCPFTVEWTGIDSAYVNGVLVPDDTTYTFSAGCTLGDFPIAVYSTDSTAFDSITVYIIPAGTIELDSAWATSTQLFYKVLFAGVEDSVRFLVGQDTVDMYVNPEHKYFGSGPTDTTVAVIKPDDYFTEDSTWYKVETIEDSTDGYVIPDLKFLGQIGGTRICWTPFQSIPIEVTGILDIGCEYVWNITSRYTTSFLQVPQTGLPSILQTYNECDYDCRTSANPTLCGCNWAHYTFQALDTLIDDYTVEEYGQRAEFQKSGATITVGTRRYYISSERLYMDDLQNNIDSTVLYDLSSYYSSSSMINPSLWQFPYRTDLTDTVKYVTGDLASALPTRDTTLMVIYEPGDFQRMWSFNSLPNPPAFEEVLSDTYKASAGFTSKKRDYFRGIHPKILKYGVE